MVEFRSERSSFVSAKKELTSAWINNTYQCERQQLLRNRNNNSVRVKPPGGLFFILLLSNASSNNKSEMLS